MVGIGGPVTCYLFAAGHGLVGEVCLPVLEGIHHDQLQLLLLCKGGERKRERERERETDRQTEKQTERKRQANRLRERERKEDRQTV